MPDGVKMSKLVVPYPTDPNQRQALFERARAHAGAGAVEGTPDSGSFFIKLPLGQFAGSYHSEPGSNEIAVHFESRPRFIPLALIEREARKLVARV